MWYKATVPRSGKLTIETSAVSGSVLDDPSIVAYTLSEGTLTEIDCNNDGGVDYFSKIELSGQAENKEIYFMVIAFRQAASYGGEHLGPFNICAFDPEATFDFPQTHKPLLSYYSNPVGNHLVIESPYQIESFSIFDLVGREVFGKQSDKQKLTIDTYSLSAGVYMLSVQIAEGAQTVKLIKK